MNAFESYQLVVESSSSSSIANRLSRYSNRLATCQTDTTQNTARHIKPDQIIIYKYGQK